MHPRPPVPDYLQGEPGLLHFKLRLPGLSAVKPESFGFTVVPNESLTKKMGRKNMTLVTTNFENELIQHSAGVTYQALGQMHRDFKRIATVSTKYRIWPGRDDGNRDNRAVESKRAMSDEVF